MGKDKYVRFDWAARRILREKTNFCILEGFFSVLLGEKIRIVEILQSESNPEGPDARFNRIDVIAKNSMDDIVMVEVHFTRELYYLECIYFSVAKSAIEYVQPGDKYEHVKKVYSINILYFDLGKGSDYLYHGQTVFRGINTGDTLQISTKENNVIEMKTPSAIFPEYFIIRVNEFNKQASTPLEEWIDYLRTGHISDDTVTPGLQQARRQLQYILMTPAEQMMYDRHIDAIMIQNDVLSTARKEGYAEGYNIGRRQGKKQGLVEGFAEVANDERLAIASKMKLIGMDAAIIQQATGLSTGQIDKLP